MWPKLSSLHAVRKICAKKNHFPQHLSGKFWYGSVSVGHFVSQILGPWFHKWCATTPPPITSFEYQFRSSGCLNVLSDCRCFLSQLFNPLDLSCIYFAGRIQRHTRHLCPRPSGPPRARSCSSLCPWGSPVCSVSPSWLTARGFHGRCNGLKWNHCWNIDLKWWEDQTR